jgi:tetratricopeptide (TPR) repeat protein
MLQTRFFLRRWVSLSLLALSLAGYGGSTAKDASTEPAETSMGRLLSAFRPVQPNAIAQLDALAKQFQTQGQTAFAEQHYRQALTIREQAWGPEHPQVTTGLDKLTDFYTAQGKYAEAEVLLQRALTIREKELGPEHPDVATSLEKYAVLLRQMHRDAEAQPLAARAQAIRAQPVQARRASTP